MPRAIKRHVLSLQAKIILTLVAVILPTFLIVTFAENKLTRPLLEEEIRQVGITSAKSLAAEIISNRWLSLPSPTARIESHIQEILYSQPNIVRIDVVARDPLSGIVKTVATNIEEDPNYPSPVFSLVEAVVSEFKRDENGVGLWEIHVPIEQKGREPRDAREARSQRKAIGTVHLVVSLKLVGRMVDALHRTTATAGAFSVVALILGLGFFLRRTIENDRKLRQAETQNFKLTEQLHDAQRQLMNTEKLAVMGQLTASFAHEIGSPLNAIGGHLQLLREDIPQAPAASAMGERLEIINGQLGRIEEIVRGFLQSTAKPPSQRQLADVNQLVDRTLGVLRPRIDSLRLEIRRGFDRSMGPLRIVPLDLEQVFLNLLNNSLDSLKAKAEGQRFLEVSTGVVSAEGKEWAEISVYDTGEGIRKADLDRVLKPFFTTKNPGEGTGLGLAICLQLVQKYGGTLTIDSREGAWTRVTIRIPYDANL